MDASAELNVTDAIDLAEAWTAHLASSHDIRALVIKGQALAELGLREARQSGDVDILIEPDRFEEYCALVQSAGWSSYPDTFVSVFMTTHSKTFMNPEWPVYLDVHRFYPGFLAPEGVAFDACWARRVVRLRGGQPVLVPDRTTSAVILALHSVRSTEEDTRHRAELERLIETPFSDLELRAIQALAGETGASGPLAEVLEALEVPAHETGVPLSDARMADWNFRMRARAGTPQLWMSVIRARPLREWPRLITLAVWPSEEDVFVAHPELKMLGISATAARIERIQRGLRSIPGIIMSRRRGSSRTLHSHTDKEAYSGGV